MSAPGPGSLSVLVTGAGGTIGSVVMEVLSRRLAASPGKGSSPGTVVATDLREIPEARRLPGVIYATADVRDAGLQALLEKHRIDVVVHLAAIVTPGKRPDRAFEYSVDVLGTKNVLACCLAAGVQKLVVTSSGAAYGYHADNPEWLVETDALRGNPAFAYADHKRQVEELLARAREEHPELAQLILRPGTVLGPRTHNQITDLFDGRVVIGLRGATTPFVLIWDEDVAEIVVQGALGEVTGAFNLAGDGAVPLRELASMMGKPFVPLPVSLLRAGLWLLKRLGRTAYGPEQVDFLRYRPVLSNQRLKRDFPYTPRKTSRQVFEHFLEARRDGALV